MKIVLNKEFTEDGLEMGLSHAVKSSCRLILSALDRHSPATPEYLKLTTHQLYILTAPGWPLRWAEAIAYMTDRGLLLFDGEKYSRGYSQEIVDDILDRKDGEA